jgi:hypothetical protein
MGNLKIFLSKEDKQLEFVWEEGKRLKLDVEEEDIEKYLKLEEIADKYKFLYDEAYKDVMDFIKEMTKKSIKKGE